MADAFAGAFVCHDASVTHQCSVREITIQFDVARARDFSRVSGARRFFAILAATREGGILCYLAIAGSLPVAAVAGLWTTRGAAFVAGDRLLDAAPSGPRWLAEPEVASVVVKVLREGAAEGRYDLGSWVLMPNHVHVLLKPGDTLPRQIAWIKGRTAFEANRVMKRSGSFWAKDYFDRWIRNRNEWEKVIWYVERNPVKAGLCKSPEDWEWSSARQRRD